MHKYVIESVYLYDCKCLYSLQTPLILFKEGPMSTKIRQKDGIVILEPTGKIIGEAISELQEVLIDQIDTSNAPCILINLRRVNKIDSAGLGTFVLVYKMVMAKGGRIAIINVGKHIKNLIVQSRLINIFEHFNTEEAAVKAFSRNYSINY